MLCLVLSFVLMEFEFVPAVWLWKFKFCACSNYLFNLIYLQELFHWLKFTPRFFVVLQSPA